MKAIIVVEGESDAEVLRAILPNETLADCQTYVAAGRSAIASIARTLLVKHRKPLAVMFDTDTLEPIAIRDLVTTMEQLLRSVAGTTSFKLIYCVPELESIFFDATVLKSVFPGFDEMLFVMFAKNSPKQALEYMFANAGGPRSLSEFLDHLTQENIEKLRSTYPIQHLMQFLDSVPVESKVNT